MDDRPRRRPAQMPSQAQEALATRARAVVGILAFLVLVSGGVALALAIAGVEPALAVGVAVLAVLVLSVSFAVLARGLGLVEYRP